MSASSMMRRLTLFMLIVGFLVMETSSQPDPNVWEGLIDATVLGKASKLLEEVMPNFSKLFTDMPNLRQMLSEALVVFGEASTYTQDPSKWNANLPAIMQNVIDSGRVTRPVITGAVARTLNGVELPGVGSAMSKLWRIISSGVSTAEVAFEEAMSGVGIDAAAVGGGDSAFSFSTDEALAVLAVALS